MATNEPTSIISTLDKIKESLSAQKSNDSNFTKSGTAAERVSLAIQNLQATFQPINPTTVASASGVHRSYIYKNAAIKSLIDSYSAYNKELKDNPPKNPDENIKTITYHLHLKLMEAYVHEYQLLKYQNSRMEKQIAALKKELETQQ